MYNALLKVLVTTADCGSFARAAERLFLSPTAVMKRMNALEEHLQLKLLERTRHGVRLTEAGQSVYQDALFLFEYSREAVERARRRAATGRNVLRVGTSLLNPCRVFMELWAGVRDHFPDTSVQVVPFEDDRAGILNEIGLIGTRFDFVVGACGSRAMHERAGFLRLGSYAICLAVPGDHPLASKKMLTLDDLRGETVVLGQRGDSAHVDAARDALEAAGVATEDTSHFYDIETFNRCDLERKLLLTLECWADIHPLLVTIPVDWSLSVPYGILHARNPDPTVKRVLSLLRRRVPKKDGARIGADGSGREERTGKP